MPKQMTELQLALSNHRAKLDTIEAISQVVVEPMQTLLSIDLENFDKRLDSWATAAPLASIIAIYDKNYKQP